MTVRRTNSQPLLRGGDFSAYQSEGLFRSAIKNMKWASIKATEGTGYTDGPFKQRWNLLGQKIKQGKMKLRVAYHFMHPGDGVGQAKHFLQTVGVHGKLPAGTRLALDWESSALSDPKALHDAASYIHKVTGEWPLVYCSDSERGRAQAAVPHAPMWDAKWGGGLPRAPFVQTSDGPGYDHDVFEGNLAQLEKFAGFGAKPSAAQSDKAAGSALARALGSGALSGKAVGDLQQLLARAGYHTGKVARLVTPEIEKALAHYQGAAGLKPTGALDKATLAKLESLDQAIDTHKGGEFRGEQDKTILGVEEKLAGLGYDVGKADGVYDAKTAAAVKQFRGDDGVKGGAGAIFGTFEKKVAGDVAAGNHAPERARAEQHLANRKRLDALTSSAAASGKLVPGASGRAVEDVQEHLRAAGYYDPKHDGRTYDARTEGAVKEFQRKAKLPATGAVDAKTWAALQKSILLAKSDTSPAQAAGEKSAAVAKTEKLLRKLGYKHVKADGLFTGATGAAVRSFQRKHHLKATGAVDGATLKAMEKASKNGPGGVRAKILQLAASQLGTTESGYNGGAALKYQHFVGHSGPEPWCADFVSWVYSKAGLPMKQSYVPYVESMLKSQGRWKGRSNPQPGDMVLFDWNGDGVPDHIGIVKKYLGNGNVETIEGNTTNPHGGPDGVFEKVRPMSEILGFGRA